MIIALHGSDRLRIDERVRALRTEHDPSGLNTTTFDQASTQLGDLRAAALAPGFFGTARVVVARLLLTEPARAGASSRAKTSTKTEALALLDEIPDSAVLVIVEPSLPPADLRALRGGAPDVRVEQLDVPRGRALVDWVRERCARYGVAIEDEAGTRLLEALYPAGWRAASRRDDIPPDLYRLDAELAKLATAAHGGVITAALVDELVAGVTTSNIWGLTDAIAVGDAEAAVREAERAVATGTPAEVLLGQLAAQYETFAAVAAGAAAGVSTTAAETGISEGRLQQAARSARRFPLSRVRRGLAALRDVDVGGKRGDVDAEDLLLGLVARLAADS